MKLDRNIEGNNGRQKYAILNWRKVDALAADALPEINAAINTLIRAGVFERGDTPEDEFFVMKLKDQFARAGILAYAQEAMFSDPEYGTEVMELGSRAGPNHPLCKRPD